MLCKYLYAWNFRTYFLKKGAFLGHWDQVSLDNALLANAELREACMMLQLQLQGKSYTA